MTREISRATVAFVAEHEGFRTHAYPDPGSNNGLPWTIGCGNGGA